MISINEVFVGGNLTRDPEVKYVGAKNTPLVNFSVAVNNNKGSEDASVTFFNCCAWFGQAEVISKEFKKGSEIVLIGELQNEKWTYEGVEKTRDKVRVKRFGKSVAEFVREAAEEKPARAKKETKPKEEVVTEADKAVDIEVPVDKEKVPF